MIAIATPTVRTDNDQVRFLELLPKIRRQARAAFSSADHEAREEFIAEVVANAYCAFVRLVELGKQGLAFATPLASTRFARYVLAGVSVAHRATATSCRSR